MKIISTWLAAAIAALMLNGCQTPQGMSKLTVTDNQEKDYKWPEPKTHFSVGETPVVRVIGCEGKKIRLQLINVSSGSIERETSELFPKPVVNVGPERIKMGTIANSWDGPVVPVRYKQIDIYKSRFFWPLSHLPAGMYEVRLIVEGNPAEKFAFSISGRGTP
ncbi:MAG TPA: hypothetical protein VFV23_00485 [Verrucomicrobiae bacterium]|nr:hypothetical protein [Verrucomicrobiae bacterium]